MQVTQDEQSREFRLRIASVRLPFGDGAVLYSLWGESTLQVARDDYFLTDDSDLIFFRSPERLVEHLRGEPKSFVMLMAGGQAMLSVLRAGKVEFEPPPTSEVDFDFGSIAGLLDALARRATLPETDIGAAHAGLNGYLDVGSTLAHLDGREDDFFFPRLIRDEPLSQILDWGQDIWDAWHARGEPTRDLAEMVVCHVDGLDVTRARDDHGALARRLLSRAKVLPLPRRRDESGRVDRARCGSPGAGREETSCDPRVPRGGSGPSRQLANRLGARDAHRASAPGERWAPRSPKLHCIL
jgi:hypothetical protein